MFRLGRSTLEVKRKLGAYDCGSGGRWFESTQLYQAEITQETASHDSLFLALILRRVGTGSALCRKIRPVVTRYVAPSGGMPATGPSPRRSGH